MASDKVLKLTLSSPAVLTTTAPMCSRRPVRRLPVLNSRSDHMALRVHDVLGLDRGVFFEAFAAAVDISFARMLHPTAVWNVMWLAGVGSERRLHEAIRIVNGDHGVKGEITRRRRLL